MSLVGSVIFLRGEHSADRRTNRQGLKVIAGNQLRFGSLRGPTEGNGKRRQVTAEYEIKSLSLLAEVLIHRIRCGPGAIVVPQVWSGGPDHHQLFRPGNRKKAQQQLVKESENRCIRSDSKREREDGNSGEHGSPHQRAESILDVESDSRHQIKVRRSLPVGLLSCVRLKDLKER